LYEDEVYSVGGESSVDDILAKRGIVDNNVDENEDTDEGEEHLAVFKDVCKDNAGAIESDSGPQTSDHLNFPPQIQKDCKPAKHPVDRSSNGDNTEVPGNEFEEDYSSIIKVELMESTELTGIKSNAKEMHFKDRNSKGSKIKDSNSLAKDNTFPKSDFEQSLAEQKKLTKKIVMEADDANKESRKLRRNVVKLNADLDAAERELEAQRMELERAAMRMEKDRQRFKEEKQHMEWEQKEEMKRASEEHRLSTEVVAASHVEQLSCMDDRIKRAEVARVKEGGDMSMELTESAARERETLKKVLSLEEEKSTLISQVSSLNAQMSALHSRLNSVQQAAESSSEREREADDRLDAALSLHARQISQRQAREAELERTIADLGAALVVARQKEINQFNDSSKETGNESDDSDIMTLKGKLTLAEDETEMFQAQLTLERQRSETLQNEFEEMSQERTHETSVWLARQKQHDRKISDLTLRVSQLQSSLHHMQLEGNDYNDQLPDEVTNSRPTATEKELLKQISSLSEEVIKLRSKFEYSNSEVSALRNRLRSALENAEKLNPSNDAINDIEMGINLYQRAKTRRRVGKRAAIATTSIRSVIRLEAERSGTSEKVGNFIDVVDNWAINTGSYFRSNALARATFLLYLTILHIWAFCLVLFHAHWSLEPPIDLGPAQLLKHSYRQASNP